TLYRGRDGRILAGTNRGLFSFDSKKWANVPGFPPKAIYAISEDKSGNLLFGGPDGVFSSSGKQFTDGDTRAFAAFGGKIYAAIFQRGLQDLNDTKATGILSGTNPTALFAAGETLWIGTSDGTIYSFNGHKTSTDPVFDVLRGAAIRKITRGDENAIWIAGSKGIFRYSDGALESIVTNYDVRDLIADGSDVWAATVNGGLLHIGRDELFGWIVSDLNVEQGMPSQQVFALLKSENGLMIGTNRGVVNYSPVPVQPKVVISRVLSRRLYRPEEWNNLIRLDYPENSLLVEVAGQSSRTFPEQFQYAFLLKNAAGDLIEKRLSHDSQYSPSNLKPGEYTIEARAFNKDLLFSDPVAIHFSVSRAPFPWTATALGVLLVIALIALIWAMIERRRIAQRNKELAAARYDLANEAERERSRIARDLHDQTLADLRNLMMMSDRLSPPNTEFRSEIESVSTEIRRICEDLSPSVLENVGLVAALEFLLTRTTPEHNFSTSDDANELVKFPIIVQLHIYRIAQEVLTNINHHSDATHIEMSVEVSADARFLLTVRDNGSPFDPEVASGKGRGIANVRSRAALIDANIQWEQYEGGNTFSLELAGKVNV
ncbi:MAG TPA: ATP-binding protein, partial [Pyrinomonadaceae bacterium]|nr:ATP-binding protein [Pyrinomonadaceae bacterium]